MCCVILHRFENFPVVGLIILTKVISFFILSYLHHLDSMTIEPLSYYYSYSYSWYTVLAYLTK